MRSLKTMPATPQSVTSQIAQLPELAMPEIKSLWQRLFHGDTPTHNRQFLERRIAYKLQEIEFRKVGASLLDRNKRRIESLIETGKVKTRDPDYRPVTGTMLTREYQDKELDLTRFNRHLIRSKLKRRASHEESQLHSRIQG